MNQISNFCLLMSNSIATNLTQIRVDGDKNDYRKNDQLFDRQPIYEKNGTEITPSTESNNK